MPRAGRTTQAADALRAPDLSASPTAGSERRYALVAKLTETAPSAEQFWRDSSRQSICVSAQRGELFVRSHRTAGSLASADCPVRRAGASANQSAEPRIHG